MSIHFKFDKSLLRRKIPTLYGKDIGEFHRLVVNYQRVAVSNQANIYYIHNLSQRTDEYWWTEWFGG